MRIGPAGDVAGGPDVRDACLEVLVDHHASIRGQSGPIGELRGRTDTDADDDEVGVERNAARERHVLVVDRVGRIA
jgi:hypothetical protein